MIIVVENGEVVFSEEEVLNLDTIADDFPDLDTVIEYLNHHHYERAALPLVALRRLLDHARGMVA